MSLRSTRNLVCALGISILASAVAGADAASPTVAGPVTGGNGKPVLFSHGAFDLATVGYTQSEFFLSGTANAYASAVPLTSDGKWTVQPSSQAAYVTRIVVDRPIRAKDFNGTVVVEWFNVSGQVDASPAWTYTHTELLRSGYAWVGVSAQFLGINQLKCATGGVPGCPAPGDPARYATLVHPGDSYSYDIFSQAGQAILDNAELVLDGLHPQRLIADGESQSAARLVTYVNAVHPLVDVYDGYLIGSRGAAGSALTQNPLPPAPAPNPTLIRNDLSARVLVLNSETDAGSLLARQPDNPVYRLWEVAGSSHFDLYGLFLGGMDNGGLQTYTDMFNSMLNPPTSPTPTSACPLPVNTGQRSFVQRAALSGLNRWIITGRPAASAPRLETISISPVQYALDENGNVLGGIRNPAVDAPVAKLSGLGQVGQGAQFCFLFGTTVPFTAEQLDALYPNHGQFVSKWTLSAVFNTLKGFILPVDAAALIRSAVHSDVGN